MKGLKCMAFIDIILNLLIYYYSQPFPMTIWKWSALYLIQELLYQILARITNSVDFNLIQISSSVKSMTKNSLECDPRSGTNKPLHMIVFVSINMTFLHALGCSLFSLSWLWRPWCSMDQGSSSGSTSTMWMQWSMYCRSKMMRSWTNIALFLATYTRAWS